MTLNFQQLHLNQLTVQKHGVGLCLRDPDLDLELSSTWKCISTSRLWAESPQVFLAQLMHSTASAKKGWMLQSSSEHTHDYLKCCATNTRVLWELGMGEGMPEETFKLRKWVFPCWVLGRKIQFPSWWVLSSVWTAGFAFLQRLMHTFIFIQDLGNVKNTRYNQRLALYEKSQAEFWLMSLQSRLEPQDFIISSMQGLRILVCSGGGKYCRCHKESIVPLTRENPGQGRRK